MAFTITRSCISCDRCRPHCPTGAIERIDGFYFIDPGSCNDCVGYYGTPQCASFCPTRGACQKSTPANTDYWESWFAHYERAIGRLKASEGSRYWDNWFDLYSRKLHSLLAASEKP
jgi:uncharacterized Fe-S center protein